MEAKLRIYFDRQYTWVGVVFSNPSPRSHGTIARYCRLEEE
nr:MAG TPA: hypothetical protein [Caudoviricetes sp.]